MQNINAWYYVIILYYNVILILFCDMRKSCDIQTCAHKYMLAPGHACHLRVCVAALPPRQGWVIMTEASWPTKPKRLTTWTSTERVCWSRATSCLAPTSLSLGPRLLVKVKARLYPRDAQQSFKYNPIQGNTEWRVVHPLNLKAGYFFMKMAFTPSIVKCWQVRSCRTRAGAFPFWTHGRFPAHQTRAKTELCEQQAAASPADLDQCLLHRQMDGQTDRHVWLSRKAFLKLLSHPQFWDRAQGQLQFKPNVPQASKRGLITLI